MNEKLENILIELAEKLHTTVEHLWGVLVTQAVYQNFISIIIWSLFSIGSLIVVGFTGKSFFKACRDDKFNNSVPFFVIAAVIAVICLTAGTTNLNDWITAILNPEYWALKQVLP